MFDGYCAECGIIRHKTVRFTPQQNGIAERMNRTLLEKVRCLLFTSGLSKGFWGEALATATYLINRSPNRTIGFKCPIEMWTDRKPNLSYLRVFGCSAYAHIKEGKLDPRSIRCIFLGYQTGVKGYRMWDSDTLGIKIIISRDVVFNEKEFPYKTNNNTTQPIENTSIEVEPVIIREEQDQVEQEGSPDQGQGSAVPTDNINDPEMDHGHEETAETLVPSQTEQLQNYQLARDS